MRWPVIGEETDEDGNDDMRYCHASTADQEQWSTAEVIHGPDRGADAHQLCNVEDAGHDQLHTAVKAHGAEQSRRIIDQSIDTDELPELSVQRPPGGG